MNEEKILIELIKSSMLCWPYMKCDLIKEAIEIVGIFYKLYSETKEYKYLEIAVIFIKAYVELGFDYSNGEIFDEILEEFGTSKKEMFPVKYYMTNVIKLNKSQVRSMIGKWPATKDRTTMKISEVVDDIILKVRNKEFGVYTYVHPSFPKNIYQLFVGEQSYFYDHRNTRYFTLSE